MGGLVIFGIIVVAVVLFDLLASRYGVDSRSDVQVGFTPARNRPI